MRLSLLATGNLTHKEIAIKFGVARSTITEIKSGKRWKHLDLIPASVKKISLIPKLVGVDWSSTQGEASSGSQDVA